MAACPACGAELETPLGCSSCGVLFSPQPPPTPFAVLGLEPAFRVDPAQLRKRQMALSRIVHPDYFGARDAATRALAERNTAELNAAFETLADPLARADWLVRSLGGPSESEQRDMPQAFLIEVLEWNEALAGARESGPGSAGRAALDELEGALHAQWDDALASLERLLTPLPARGSPALVEARRRINALRYLEKTLAEIEALRLAQASSR